MSEMCIGCPVSRYGGQRPCQNPAPRRGRLPGRKRRVASGGAAHKLPASLANKHSVQVRRVRESVLPSRAVKPRRCNGLVVSLDGRLPKTGL